MHRVHVKCENFGTQSVRDLCFLLSPGVKFAPSTKEFTVSIPGKGNAIFKMEKKVKMAIKDEYVVSENSVLWRLFLIHGFAFVFTLGGLPALC